MSKQGTYRPKIRNLISDLYLLESAFSLYLAKYIIYRWIRYFPFILIFVNNKVYIYRLIYTCGTCNSDDYLVQHKVPEYYNLVEINSIILMLICFESGDFETIYYMSNKEGINLCLNLITNIYFSRLYLFNFNINSVT